LAALFKAGKMNRLCIDASPEMIEVAKKKASRSAPEIVFEVGLIEKLAFLIRHSTGHQPARHPPLPDD